MPGTILPANEVIAILREHAIPISSMDISSGLALIRFKLGTHLVVMMRLPRSNGGCYWMESMSLTDEEGNPTRYGKIGCKQDMLDEIDHMRQELLNVDTN